MRVLSCFSSRELTSYSSMETPAQRYEGKSSRDAIEEPQDVSLTDRSGDCEPEDFLDHLDRLCGGARRQGNTERCIPDPQNSEDWAGDPSRYCERLRISSRLLSNWAAAFIIPRDNRRLDDLKKDACRTFQRLPGAAQLRRHGALPVPGRIWSRCLKTGGTAKICRRSNLKRINSVGVIEIYPQSIPMGRSYKERQ